MNPATQRTIFSFFNNFCDGLLLLGQITTLSGCEATKSNACEISKARHCNLQKQGKTIEGWIAAARAGDRDALGDLLEEFRDYVILLARARIHPVLQAKGDPSDIAQEVCLAAYEGIERFHGVTPEDFAVWLRGILVKKLAMHLRAYLGTQKRDLRFEVDLNRSMSNASNFLHHNLAGDATSPSQHVVRNEDFLELAQALESLKPEYRDVILLRHMDGLPFSEVAKQMDRSVDAVEKLWVRALIKMKSLLGT